MPYKVDELNDLVFYQNLEDGILTFIKFIMVKKNPELHYIKLTKV